MISEGTIHRDGDKADVSALQFEFEMFKAGVIFPKGMTENNWGYIHRILSEIDPILTEKDLYLSYCAGQKKLKWKLLVLSEWRAEEERRKEEESESD